MKPGLLYKFFYVVTHIYISIEIGHVPLTIRVYIMSVVLILRQQRISWLLYTWGTDDSILSEPTEWHNNGTYVQSVWQRKIKMNRNSVPLAERVALLATIDKWLQSDADADALCHRRVAFAYVRRILST